jgi:hypothetical protein
MKPSGGAHGIARELHGKAVGGLVTDRSSYVQDLGDLLERLKVRSGRSYESIGRRVHASKSTVHRYCTGKSLPQEFALLERIGKACGAAPEEMVRLHRLWLAATTGTVDTADGAQAVPGSTQLNGRLFSPRKRLMSVLRAVLVASLVVVSTSSAPYDGLTRPRPVVGQWISGPAWALPAAPVPNTLFGVTINSGMGVMPSFRVGAVRLWDSGTRWSEIQAARGEFDWSVLDRQVSAAGNAGLPALFVLGGTPRWANPAGPIGPYPDDSTPAPPNDLTDWDAYVRGLVQRYRGRIEAYELWVLANDRRYYAGSVENLVEMTRRASVIIRSIDPRATVVCPGMGQLWTPAGIQFLERFAELGGYNYCDVAGVKLFQKGAADPPETMLDLVATIDRAMHEAGVQPRLWNTGTTYDIPLRQPLDETKARDYAVRFFLVGLYSRNANLERMYFYNWGGTRIPIVLQAVGGAPTSAAMAVEQLQRWLAHAQSRSCGHGAAIGLPGNTWECDFTITEPTRTYDAQIRWTDTGTATVDAGPQARGIRRLDGSTTTVAPGDAVTITEEPVLIESHPH